MERCNIRFSQIDSVYPLSGNEELYYGVPLRVQIYWDVRTWLPLTGSRNQRDFPKIELMKRACGTTVETAERYDININIEVHGYFTTNPEFLEEYSTLLKAQSWDLILILVIVLLPDKTRFNFVNVLISKVHHAHLKGVSESLFKGTYISLTKLAL